MIYVLVYKNTDLQIYLIIQKYRALNELISTKIPTIAMAETHNISRGIS